MNSQVDDSVVNPPNQYKQAFSTQVLHVLIKSLQAYTLMVQ